MAVERVQEQDVGIAIAVYDLDRDTGAEAVSTPGVDDPGLRSDLIETNRKRICEPHAARGENERAQHGVADEASSSVHVVLSDSFGEVRSAYQLVVRRTSTLRGAHTESSRGAGAEGSRVSVRRSALNPIPSRRARRTSGSRSGRGSRRLMSVRVFGHRVARA